RAEQRRGAGKKKFACLSPRSGRVCELLPAHRAAQGTPQGPGLRLAFLLGTFLWRSKEKCLGRRAETRPATKATSQRQKKNKKTVRLGRSEQPKRKAKADGRGRKKPKVRSLGRC